MKLEDHVLKEHRTVHMTKDGQRYLLRIVSKTNPVCRLDKNDGKSHKAFYADVWGEFKLKKSRIWCVGFEQAQFRSEHDSIKEALESFRQKGFSLLHPRPFCARDKILFGMKA